MVENVAEDVLVLIFEEVVGGPLTQWPDAVYDHNKAAAPFRLSAVCRQWRALARDTAVLWTYFGFPESAGLYPRQSERLQAQLSLSKNAPIDAIFCLGTPYNFYGAEIVEQARQCQEVLEAIGQLGARWRNVRFRLPAQATEHLRPALMGGTPLLEAFSAVTNATWHFFPSAPRLDRLYTESQHIESAYRDNVVHYPSMTSLAVISDTSDRAALTHSLCVHNYQNLTEVCIMDDLHSPPAEPIQLPLLRTLALDDARYLPHITAERLQRLVLNASSNVQFHEHLGRYAQVTELVLYGSITVDSIGSMYPLNHVKSLSFDIPSGVRTCFKRYPAYNIFSAVFTSLNIAEQGPVFPDLERIHFVHQRDDKDSVCHYPQDLVDFVRGRNSGLISTARIVEVIGAGPPEEAGPESVIAQKFAQLSLALRQDN